MYTALNVVLLACSFRRCRSRISAPRSASCARPLQLVGPVRTATYPRLAFLQRSNERQRARLLAVVAVAILGFVGLLIAATLALAAPTIISVVFGPGYGEAVWLLRILVLLIPAFIVSSVASGWLMSLHRDRTVVRVVLCAGVLNVALAVVLVPMLGPVGMALSVMAAEFTAAIGYVLAIAPSEGYRRGRSHGGRSAGWSRLRPGWLGARPRVSTPPASRTALP